jgi:hypothetical protein
MNDVKADNCATGYELESIKKEQVKFMNQLLMPSLLPYALGWKTAEYKGSVYFGI